MQIGAREFNALGYKLAEYDRQTTISKIAGLFTIPALHPNSIRLEVLLHLSCLRCNGTKEVSDDNILSWINQDLQPIAHLEDPVTDVFIGNIMGPGGNFRVFQGLWEGSDFYLQSLIDTISLGSPPPNLSLLNKQLFSLLKLSDIAVGRCGLGRWAVGDPVPKRYLPASSIVHLKRRAQSLVFSHSDLVRLGIEHSHLEPFLLDQGNFSRLENERVGNSSLERFPLLQFDDVYLLALPSSVSPAIRRFVLEWMKSKRLLAQLAGVLRMQQSNRVLNDGLRHLGTTPVDDDIPTQDKNSLAGIDQVVCKFDSDKYAHVVLIHDDPAAALKEGLDVPQEFTEDTQKDIGNYVDFAQQLLSSKADCARGMTLIIICGLGRGFILSTKNLLNDWYYCVFSIAEFMQLAETHDKSLLRLWKMLNHCRSVDNEGLYIPHHIGFLNLYSYWQVQEYCMVPDEMPYPRENSLLQISTDFLLKFNRNIRQSNDKHAAFIEYPSRFTAVVRLLSHAFFESVTNRPIYASLPAVERRELDGIVETKKGRYWVLYRKQHEGGDASSIIYQLWEAMLFWLDRMLPELESTIPAVEKPIYIELLIKDSNLDLDFIKEDGDTEDICSTVDRDRRFITLTIPLSFLRNFNVAENIGERKLLRLLGENISDLMAKRSASNRSIKVESVVHRIMDGTAARMVHIFEVRELEDILASLDPQKPRFIHVEDEKIIQLGLAWKILKESAKKRVNIYDEDNCKGFLGKIVDELWSNISHQLLNLNRSSVVEKAFMNIEAINQDQKHWKRTAKAMLALYKDDNVIEKALKKDVDRNLASITSRVLIEMAICTSPLHSGADISNAAFDELLANIALMIEFAHDSDAIHHRLSSPEIEIAPNGMFRTDRSYMKNMVKPFVTGSFATGFNAAAAAYAELHERKQHADRVDTAVDYSSEFSGAFSDEYQISPDRVIDALAEMFSLASNMKKTVIQTSRDELSNLFKKNRNFTEYEVEAFFSSFSLVPRERWDRTPQGFRPQDWWPWRFRRRLSLVVRPIAMLSDDKSGKIYYSVSHIADSFKYIFQRIEAAWLPQEYFTSDSMRIYIGKKANALGHLFAEDVVKEMQVLGWTCRLEIPMSALGAAPELGDVDVLAWRKDDNRLLLIECKRLQPTKTVWEIGDLVNEFRGEEGDRLAKHIRRCEWLKKNTDKVIELLKLPSAFYKAIPLIITNAHVPFKFWKNLAIPSENVVELHSIKDWLHNSK